MAAGYSAASDLANKLRVQRAKQMGANPGQPGAPVDPVPDDIASARAIQAMAPPTFTPGSSPLPQPKTNWSFSGGDGSGGRPGNMSPVPSPEPFQWGASRWQSAPAAPAATAAPPSVATATPGGTVYGGEMGPPAPDRRQEIAVRDAMLTRDIQRRQYMAHEGRAIAPGVEDRWALGDERFAIDNAHRPVQQPQSVPQITANRDELFYKGLGAVDSLQQRAAAELDPAKKAAMLAESQRMEQAFRRDLHPHTGQEAEGIQAGQRANVPIQQANRSAWADEAGTYTAANQGADQFGREAVAAKTAIARARMASSVAGAKTEQYGAEAGATPEMADQMQRIKVLGAQTAATQAQTEQAKARAANATTQVTADASVASAPLEDPRLDNAVKAFASASQAGVGVFGGTDSVALTTSSAKQIMDYVSALPPDQRAAVKGELRNSLPLSTETRMGDYLSAATGVLSGPHAVARAKQNAAIRQLREFLSQ